MADRLRVTQLQVIPADRASRDQGVLAWLSFVVSDDARAGIAAYLLRQTGPHLRDGGGAA